MHELIIINMIILNNVTESEISIVIQHAIQLYNGRLEKIPWKLGSRWSLITLKAAAD